jgi:signal transduction histidine kinase
MRSEVEQILGRPDLPPDLQSALVSLQDEIARLDRITEHLLQLARFDAGQIVLKQTEVDCSSLLKDACEDAELLASAAEVTLDFDVAPDVRLRGDPHHLRRLFLNLLDNACKHNQHAGQVRCWLKRESDSAVLRVANTGPGIPTAMRSRVFERFFRTDPSRPNLRSHGLGLALSWEIVALHDGSLTLVENSAPGWTEFEVRFPLVK